MVKLLKDTSKRTGNKNNSKVKIQKSKVTPPAGGQNLADSESSSE